MILRNYNVGTYSNETFFYVFAFYMTNDHVGKEYELSGHNLSRSPFPTVQISVEGSTPASLQVEIIHMKYNVHIDGQVKLREMQNAVLI